MRSLLSCRLEHTIPGCPRSAQGQRKGTCLGPCQEGRPHASGLCAMRRRLRSFCMRRHALEEHLVVLRRERGGIGQLRAQRGHGVFRVADAQLLGQERRAGRLGRRLPPWLPPVSTRARPGNAPAPPEPPPAPPWRRGRRPAWRARFGPEWHAERRATCVCASASGVRERHRSGCCASRLRNSRSRPPAVELGLGQAARAAACRLPRLRGRSLCTGGARKGGTRRRRPARPPRRRPGRGAFARLRLLNGAATRRASSSSTSSSRARVRGRRSGRRSPSPEASP